jgi:hypothetical protein
MNTSSCTLRITNSTFADLGIWRCAMEKLNNDVFYGFLRVTDNETVAEDIGELFRLTSTNNSFNEMQSFRKIHTYITPVSHIS